MNLRNLEKGAHLLRNFDNVCNNGGTRHERLGKKGLHVLTQLYYGVGRNQSKQAH